MNGWTKLWATIITSSIWSEDDKTRLVWITLLAVADKYDNVSGAIPGIAALARVSVKDCRKALEKLEQPDADSRSTESEGRRIQKIEGGWHIINRRKYREMASEIERREYLRQKQAERRQKLKNLAPEKEICQQSVNKSTETSTHIDIDIDVLKNPSLSPLNKKDSQQTSTPSGILIQPPNFKNTTIEERKKIAKEAGLTT